MIRKDVEINLDQLFDLFSTEPDHLKKLLNDADCPACKSINALVGYQIILTPENGIRLEGICRFCKEELVKYAGSLPGKVFRAKALDIRLSIRGMEELEYLSMRKEEEDARKREKHSIQLKSADSPVYFQIKVSLADIHPLIWRRILVQPSTSLKSFHRILQITMGWTNSHLHQFEHDGEIYGDPWDQEDELVIDYRRMKVQDLLLYPDESCIYEYDFGDGWKHIIKLEQLVDRDERLPAVVCLDGAGKCPPEDCGGPRGYSAIKRILKSPSHPEYAGTIVWLGGKFDPDEFDLVKLNRELLRKAKFRYPKG